MSNKTLHIKQKLSTYKSVLRLLTGTFMHQHFLSSNAVQTLCIREYPNFINLLGKYVYNLYPFTLYITFSFIGFMTFSKSPATPARDTIQNLIYGFSLYTDTVYYINGKTLYNSNTLGYRHKFFFASVNYSLRMEVTCTVYRSQISARKNNSNPVFSRVEGFRIISGLS